MGASKTLTFSGRANLSASYSITLQDIDNLSENFDILSVSGVTTPQSIKLFSWLFRGGVWTLNELIFFAVCNYLVISIYDINNTLLIQYNLPSTTTTTTSTSTTTTTTIPITTTTTTV